jgi:tetratricopeptide (TPR) repeat protein
MLSSVNREERDSKSALLICFLLALVAVATFWPVWRYEFINYDDSVYVYENSHVLPGVSREGIVWAFRDTEANWHPVTWLSHMLEALNNLAWILATHPDAQLRDGTRAVELASRAVQLTRTNSAPMLDTLAVAYAETGRFAEAVETAKKALGLAESSGARQLAAGIEARLRLHKKGLPFREAARSDPRPTTEH